MPSKLFLEHFLRFGWSTIGLSDQDLNRPGVACKKGRVEKIQWLNNSLLQPYDLSLGGLSQGVFNVSCHFYENVDTACSCHLIIFMYFYETTK